MGIKINHEIKIPSNQPVSWNARPRVLFDRCSCFSSRPGRVELLLAHLRPEKIGSLSGQLFVHWRSIFYSHRGGIFAGKDAWKSSKIYSHKWWFNVYRFTLVQSKSSIFYIFLSLIIWKSVANPLLAHNS